MSVRMFSAAVVATALSAAAAAQAPTPAVTFASADVHVVPALRLGDNVSGGVIVGTRFQMRSATMVDLVRTAYGVDGERVLGGPSWLETDRFDIVANAPAGTNQDTAKQMLKALLVERFGLVTHEDSRPMPIYALTVGSGKHKMRPAGGSDPPGCRPAPPVQPPPAIPMQNGICRATTMDAFAALLPLVGNAYVDHPVLNQTKLDGEFDFEFSWTVRALLGQAGPDGVSLFDALDKQLGLKLEAQTLPQAVVIVDKVSQKPTPNAPGVVVSEAEGPLEFEAAAIKPSAPGSTATRFIYQAGGRVVGEGTLAELIAISYNVPPNLRADTLVGAPKYADSRRYEIQAKLPTTGAGAATHDGARDTPPPLSVALLMLQNLMQERFKLKVHTENQPANVYVISAAKSGPKLTKATPDERASCKPDPNPAPVGIGLPTVGVRCLNTTLAEVADKLPTWANGYFDHPAFDDTGIKGGFDFALSWTPKGMLHPAQPGAAASGAAVDPGGLSVFEAMEKQLGLKVDVQKRSIPVTVVDHVDETPID